MGELKMKFLKVGRVAIITRGRYAGKKETSRRVEGEEILEEKKKVRNYRYHDLGILEENGEHRTSSVVIIQPVDSGNKAHPFGHALVAGIERYPSKVTRRMSKTRQEKRSKIKPFVKAINYNHLMPTRYTLELEGLKGALTTETFKEVSQREDAKKNVKKVLEERYTSGKNRWFFTPLRMFPPHTRHSSSYAQLGSINPIFYYETSLQ
ncbi:hypothetical protein RRF57_005196 [Xylaria bambusicola]|uniref:60S ribosomal protein L27 n=1 Tax=Xylaria bambusicola TaxID=326684 RepID=A0AAN7Z948_9PEZI